MPASKKTIYNKPFRLVVLLSGRGSNFAALHEYLRSNELPIEICLVISDKPDAKGVELATSWGIPVRLVKRRPKELSNSEFNTELALAAKSVSPDLIVLAGFMRVLTSEFISCFPNKIINIHPSLLPAFKGLHAQEQAIHAGVKFAGCTVHVATEELDSGKILAQAVVPVLESDTVESLSARILEQEHQLLPKVVEQIAQGELKI